MNNQISFFTAVISVFFMFNTCIYAQTVVAYYPFNGNADNRVSSSSAGTVKGAILTTDRFGNPNSAYSFNGKSDVILFSDNSVVNFQEHESFAICLWFKTAGKKKYMFPLATGVQIFKPGIFTAVNYAFGGKKGCIAFGIGGTKSMDSKNAVLIRTKESTFNDDQWHHLAITVDRAAERIRIYVDGQMRQLVKIAGGGFLQNQDTELNITQLGFDPTPSHPFMIGASESSFDQYFEGIIDDVVILKGAVSPQQVRDLYENTFKLP
ncbi:MAG: LamG domain-containing protein [Thermaurantimonas sp.]|uniref:LamG domain-containing protein n=1 Tax=Thermaurantimonas sp. TaxID=2681568 RepID=UPI00391C3847